MSIGNNLTPQRRWIEFWYASLICLREDPTSVSKVVRSMFEDLLRLWIPHCCECRMRWVLLWRTIACRKKLQLIIFDIERDIITWPSSQHSLVLSYSLILRGFSKMEYKR